ncbi:hypothetical protein N9H37_02150 [Congregibacter sp.]|nr:hypothetical protein [Congregibacter sp.]MDA8962135.1 hypothetical protein [Congregibacter sp.]
MNRFLKLIMACWFSVVIAPSAFAERSFKVVQDLPSITHVDVGVEGGSHGDVMAFEAPFITEDNLSGVLSGIVTTVAITDTEGEPFTDRIGTLVFEFGETGTLIVTGGSRYALGQAEMQTDTPQVRAITGGTGRFMGARGQVTTMRKDAGHYQHYFELID